MPFAKHKIRRGILQLSDGLAAGLAFLTALFVRIHLPQGFFFLQLHDAGFNVNYLWFLMPIALLTAFTHTKIGFYHLGSNQRRGEVLNLCIQTSTFVLVIVVIGMFIGNINFLARSVFLIFIPLCALFLFLRHELFRQFIAKRATRQRQNLLLVSDRRSQTNWRTELGEHPEFDLNLAHELQIADADSDHFVRTLHDEAIHLVIFDIRHTSFEKVAQLIRAAEDEGVEAWLTTNLFDTRIAQVKVDYFLNHPVLIFRSTPDGSLQIFAKGIIDRAGSFLLLALCAIPMLIISVLIKLSDRGPVLFNQKRSGLHGRPFMMRKFRSMVANAEQLKTELNHRNEMSGPVFKITNDPRITKIGQFLRKTSLDELPQLLNVLKGEMSLVGPRPLPVYETLAISENAQRRRLSVKPGITCLWQVTGRNEVNTFEDWVKLDLEYIDNWTIWLDIKILLKTIPAVLRFHGAK
ncbi:MAG: sugar transferase [Verrucomicrobiales bacterium]|jgi:exopolysaccharide biosynthesis polyprenyl glycosylphosphotransferase|nr:sugar transferase [Verrucomicrobiales bacterium]